MNSKIKRNLLFGAMMVSMGSKADEFTVSQSLDDGTGLIENTLSWAILQANIQVGEDVITLNTDVSITGVMKRLIDSDVTIQSDSTTRTISGSNQYRPLFIKSGQVNLNRLVISNGLAKGGSSGSGGAGGGLGGALFIYDGEVNLSHVTIQDSHAIGGEAGILSSHIDEGAGMFGNAGITSGGLFDLNGNYGGYGQYQTNDNYFGQGSLSPLRIGGFGGGGDTAFGSYYDPKFPSAGGFGGGGARGFYYNGVDFYTYSSGGFGGGRGYGSNGRNGSGMGGGIFIRTGQLNLSNITIANNSADAPENAKGLGGGLFVLHRLLGAQKPKQLPIVGGCGTNFSNNTAKTIDLLGRETDDFFDPNLIINNELPLQLVDFCALVIGNELPIVNADVSPNIKDLTHFGVIELGQGQPITHSFEIKNFSLETLGLTGSPKINISGNNAGDFSLVSAPNLTIEPNEIISFDIRFDAAEEGYKEAMVRIGFDDGESTIYEFKIDGQVIDSAPEIEILGNEHTIINNNIPTIVDGTDFESIDLDGEVKTQTFQIHNRGNQPLVIDEAQGIIISGPAQSSFLVSRVLSDYNIQPGDWADFDIEFDPTISGINLAQVFVKTNDPDEADVYISITGNSLVPEVDVTCNEEWIDGIRTPISISNGDNSPSREDCTKFLNKIPNGVLPNSTADFYIRNNGDSVLEFVNSPALQITNDPQGNFQVINSIDNDSIQPSEFLFFRVEFEPQSVGYHSANIKVESSDFSNGQYEFLIEGYGKSRLSSRVVNVDNEVIEGEVINLEFSLDHAQSEDILIDYEVSLTSDSSEVEPEDFSTEILSGTLILLADTTRVNLYIPTNADGIVEGEENAVIYFNKAEENVEDLVDVIGFPYKTVSLTDGNSSDFIFFDGFE